MSNQDQSLLLTNPQDSSMPDKIGFVDSSGFLEAYHLILALTKWQPLWEVLQSWCPEGGLSCRNLSGSSSFTTPEPSIASYGAWVGPIKINQARWMRMSLGDLSFQHSF